MEGLERYEEGRRSCPPLAELEDCHGGWFGGGEVWAREDKDGGKATALAWPQRRLARDSGIDDAGNLVVFAMTNGRGANNGVAGTASRLRPKIWSNLRRNQFRQLLTKLMKAAAEQNKEEAAGFLQQTGEQMKNMAQGAVDSVKHTLGMDKK
ncbi:hypothetical protein V8G54_029435 [Vigna mungo]|uniref:Uncharacterized protein n=1 Tax=Vigna mungo TaxID=3915 RepID=A0AAQ3MTD8_VIGMU